MGLLNQTQQKAGLLNRSSPSVPSPQLPQTTANSTQKTSFQIPNEISVNFSVPKEVTKPSFPLQGTTISSAPTEEVSPVRQLISKISSPFVREIATGVVDAPHKIFFGDPQVREQIKDLESKGYKVPFTEDFVASGFLPTLGKTQEEIIDDKAQRMVGKGIDPTRAYEVATADTLKRKLPKMGELGDIEDMKKSDEYYNSLSITDEEKSSLRTSNIVYSLMAGLDIAGNLPVGATVENVTKGLLRIAESKNANTIAGELIKLGVPKEKVGSLAEVLTKVDKPEVIHDLVQGAIGSQSKGGLLGRSVEKVTDPVQINEIKQTIKEGEDVLATKTYQGAEITQDQADEIARSIDNAKARIGEEVSSTPKSVSNTENLIDEAKKYKSAEEFVKAQGEPVYHGGGISDISDIKWNDFSGRTTQNTLGEGYDPISNFGINFSDNKSIANEFSTRGGGGMLETYFTPNKVKKFNTDNSVLDTLLQKAYDEGYGDSFLSAKKLKGTSAKNEFMIDNQFDSSLVEKVKDDLIEQGYDAISFRNTMDGGITYIPLKESAVKTKSQLTDIWNKANETKPVQKTIEEVYKPRTQEELAQSKTKLEKRLDAISELKKTEEKVKKTGRTPEQQERLEGLQAMKDSIESTGFLDLRKYESKRGEFKGQLNINTGTGKFAKEYDTKLREVFNDNDNRYYAEELVDKYENLKISYDNIVDDIKQIERTTSLQKQGQKQFATTPIEVTSVESKAEEYLLRTPDIYWKDVLPFDDIVNRSVTDVKDKINILDYIRTPDRVLSKIGFDKEAKLVRQGYEAYLKELPKNIDKITEWSKRVPSKESNIKIFQYLDGKDVVLSSEEIKVAGEIREWLQGWAKRLNLPDDKQITHYITHIFDKELIAKEFDEDLAKIIAERIPSQVYDPFLEKRLGKLGYKQNTWEALDAYIKRATRKANMDPALEAMQTKAGSSLEFSKLEKSQFEYIKNYIDRVNMRPTWLDEQVDNAIKSMFGYRFGARPVTYLTRLLRQLTYRGMLGLNPTSALRNISQGVNTYAKLGEKYTTLGYLGLFKKGALQELKDTGVLADSFIQDRALSSTKKAIEKVDKGLWAMFQTAETINRGSAYFGAKAKALAEGKTPEEAIEYAKKLVRDTQFSFGSIDTPVGLQSDLTKTLLQFQNYTVKQIEFLTEMAKNKEYAGLMRYALGGLAFVYTIGQAFNMKPEQLIPTFRFDTPPSLKFPVEVAKAVADTPDKYNQDRDIETKLADIGKSLLGLIPAGTQIKKTVEGLIAIQKGASVDKGGNIQYEIPQTTEGKIQTLLFGKSSTEGAKKYFDRAEQAKKDMESIQPIYDQIQELKNAGKNDEAIALYDALGEKGKEVYKKIKAQKKSEQTKEGKLDLLPTFQKIRSLKEEGKTEEAIQMYDSLTDEQKKYYQLLKKQLEGKKVSESETSGLSKMVLSALGIETASAMEKPEGQQLPETDKIKTAIENVYDQAEIIAPMIDKNYIKTLVNQESSNGTDDRNRKYDQGKYGWIVGFTKPTYQNIVEKAKTQKKYRNLLSSMSGFDTPENAIKSALVYSQFLMRDHTKEQETGKREWKDITATELYKLYNGGGSPKGVVSFDQKFNNQYE